MPLKVGKDILNGKKLSYRFTPCDANGWIDSRKYMPADFDLVFIKVDGKKALTGWLNGSHWDGINVNISASELVYWKRNHIEVLDR